MKTFTTLSGVDIPNRLFVHMIAFCPRIMDKHAFKRLRLVSKSWYQLIDKALIARCFRVVHGNIREVRKAIRERNVFEIPRMLIYLNLSSNCCLNPLSLLNHVKEIVEECEIVAMDFSETCVYNPGLVSVIEKILRSCSRLEVLKMGNLQATIRFHLCKNLKYFSCNFVGYNSRVKVNLNELKCLRKVFINTIVKGKITVPKDCEYVTCRVIKRDGRLNLWGMEDRLDNVSIGKNNGIVRVDLKRLRCWAYLKWCFKMGPSYTFWLVFLVIVFVGCFSRAREIVCRVLLRFLELL